MDRMMGSTPRALGLGMALALLLLAGPASAEEYVRIELGGYGYGSDFYRLEYRAPLRPYSRPFYRPSYRPHYSPFPGYRSHYRPHYRFEHRSERGFGRPSWDNHRRGWDSRPSHQGGRHGRGDGRH